MNLVKNPLTFRCRHRHSAASHPKCYLKFIRGEDVGPGRLPQILIFDIERAPLQAFIWNVWKTDVHDENIISEWFTLSWSAKWLFDDQIMSERLTGREAKNEDDSRIVKNLWKLLNEADIVIAHNAVGFDIPNMNTRFIVNDLPPTIPYQIIDTLKVARKQFGFTHNGLDALAKVFGLEPKKSTNFALWKKCVAGDDKALQEMEQYNIGDVELLEDVYLKLRPWIKGHPNLGLYVESDEPVCPNCGSEEIKMLEGKFSRSSVGKYPLFMCECGAFGRLRKSVLDKSISKNLLVGV